MAPSLGDDKDQRSLHYHVKAFLFSVPLQVHLDSAAGRLRQLTITSEFKMPPFVGRAKSYSLKWDYSPVDRSDGLNIIQSFDGRKQEQFFARHGGDSSTGFFDLARYFWDSTYRLDLVHEPLVKVPIYWIEAHHYIQFVEEENHQFVLELHKGERFLAKLEGLRDEQGLLTSLRKTAGSGVDWSLESF